MLHKLVVVFADEHVHPDVASPSVTRASYDKIRHALYDRAYLIRHALYDRAYLIKACLPYTIGHIRYALYDRAYLIRHALLRFLAEAYICD